MLCSHNRTYPLFLVTIITMCRVDEFSAPSEVKCFARSTGSVTTLSQSASAYALVVALLCNMYHVDGFCQPPAPSYPIARGRAGPQLESNRCMIVDVEAAGHGRTGDVRQGGRGALVRCGRPSHGRTSRALHSARARNLGLLKRAFPRFAELPVWNRIFACNPGLA